MALQAILDSLDKVPEALRGEYVEKDGKFHLNVEGGEDVGGLKSALASERAARKQLDKDIAAWKKFGKTPDEIAELTTAAEKAAEEAAKKAGNFDTILQQHKDKAAKERADVEARLTGERDSALGLARKAIVSTSITAALTKAKATPEGLDLLNERLGKRVKLEFDATGKETVTIMDADGEEMVGSGKNGLATYEDLVKEAIKNYPSLFEGSGTGGSGSDQKNQRNAGGKTITRADFEALQRTDPVGAAQKIQKEGYKVV